jgi:hypothetical protein
VAQGVGPEFKPQNHKKKKKEKERKSHGIFLEAWLNVMSWSVDFTLM